MNLHTGLLAGLVVSVGVIASTQPLWATPDGSQRLRGLGDRVFLVTAELTEDRLGIGFPIGTTLPNCYIFSAEPDSDGNTWFESAFPETKGTWAQDSNGAKTSYAVAAFTGLGETVTQLGRVTPGLGKGTLQIVADSFVDIIPGGPPELEFFSVGTEIDASEMDSKCPDFPDFTFPD